jgi:non-heme chloroperoxidase
VLIASVPPLMLKTPANAGGTPIEALDKIRAGIQAAVRAFASLF